MTAFVHIFTDNLGSGFRQRSEPPGSSDRQGLLLGSIEETVAIEGFGNAQSGQPHNQVHLVATNQSSRSEAGLELEIYVLDPPAHLVVEDPDVDPMKINWDPSRHRLAIPPAIRGSCWQPFVPPSGWTADTGRR